MGDRLGNTAAGHAGPRRDGAASGDDAARRLRVALVQLAIRDGQPAVNLERATASIRSAGPADLYVLPELWTTGYAHDTWARVADRETPAIVEALRALAAECGAYIAGSMISRDERGALVNRLWLVPPTGAAPVHYDKGHLIALMGEDRYLSPGDRRVVTPLGGWRAGLSICFDLRFPEMYRADALDGAELFVVVSEWPAARAEAQRVLARARAIENQAFVVLCNRVGTAADGTRFDGGSVVVAPDGKIMADAGGDEGVARATLDVGAIHAVRRQMPLLELRREGLDWATSGGSHRPAYAGRPPGAPLPDGCPARPTPGQAAMTS
jgi:predicted amidohydrolase